jgi:uncharacterized delta-60 repeat protein
MTMRSHIGLRTMVVSFASACLIALATAPPSLAVAGTLDPTFSGDGKAITNFTTGDDYIWDIALQLDGKIVGAGGSDSGRSVALARYNTDGTPDATFGAGGMVTTDMTTGADQAQAVAVQVDQKIVVVGRAGGSGGRFGLARYDTAGGLDPTFSGDGKVFTNLVSGYDHAWALAIQPDGKIVAAGAAQVGGGAFALVRYNADGTRDTSFSGDGKVTTNFTSGDDWVWDIALQVDGKIVASGVAGTSPSNKMVALARYNTDGSLDGSFSGDGKLTRNPTSGWEDAAGVGIQPDGKIVIAGAGGGNGGRLLVIRFNPNGRIDSTFSGDGIARTNFTSRDDFAWDVSLQTDGKIVAAGTAGLGSGTGDFAVARYGTTGTLDSSFGVGGKVVTSVTTGVDVATAVTIQVDGNIVVGGRVGGAGGRFGVVRYLAA